MKSIPLICTALLVLLACTVPAGAVVLEVTVKGTVADLSPANNTLTLAGPSRYGCDYGSGTSAPVCSWTPLNATALTGTVPDPAVFSVVARNDPVVAVSLGGTGGTWIAFAKLYGAAPAADNATDEIGDIGSLPTTLTGDYSVTGVEAPDCSACTGTSCTAASSDVTIKSGTMAVAHQTLLPGQSLLYTGRNDASSVNVMFVNGEASSETCPGSSGLIGGVQPVSDYIVHVVPPLGMTTAAAGGGTSPAPATTPGPSGTTTPKASLPSGELGVLGLGIAALAACRRGN